MLGSMYPLVAAEFALLLRSECILPWLIPLLLPACAIPISQSKVTMDGAGADVA